MAGTIFSILFAMATGVWFYFLNKKAKKIHHNITLMNNELEGKKTTYKDIEDLITKGKEKIRRKSAKGNVAPTSSLATPIKYIPRAQMINGIFKKPII